MVEFFQNCWQWIVTNSDKIVIFITSSQFISIVVAIITIIKSIKTNKNNLENVKNMQKDFASVLQMSESVSDVKNAINETFNDEFYETMTKLKNDITLLTNKINCIIDVQSLVYSTIKDDNIRNAVNSILTEAKYCSTAIKENLEEEIANLKLQLQEKMDDIQNVVEESTDKVKKTVNTSRC